MIESDTHWPSDWVEAFKLAPEAEGLLDFAAWAELHGETRLAATLKWVRDSRVRPARRGDYWRLSSPALIHALHLPVFAQLRRSLCRQHRSLLTALDELGSQLARLQWYCLFHGADAGLPLAPVDAFSVKANLSPSVYRNCDPYLNAAVNNTAISVQWQTALRDHTGDAAVMSELAERLLHAGKFWLATAVAWCARNHFWPRLMRGGLFCFSVDHLFDGLLPSLGRVGQGRYANGKVVYVDQLDTYRGLACLLYDVWRVLTGPLQQTVCPLPPFFVDEAKPFGL